MHYVYPKSSNDAIIKMSIQILETKISPCNEKGVFHYWLHLHNNHFDKVHTFDEEILMKPHTDLNDGNMPTDFSAIIKLSIPTQYVSFSKMASLIKEDYFDMGQNKLLAVGVPPTVSCTCLSVHNVIKVITSQLLLNCHLVL